MKIRRYTGGCSHIILAIATVLMVAGCQDDDSDTAGTDPVDCLAPPPAPPANFCSAALSLAPAFPGDVAFDPNTLSPDQSQQMFDCLSWQTFVALNWPAQQACRGVPDENASFSRVQGLRVWETWKEVFELFQDTDPDWNPAGQDWNDPMPAVACSDIAEDRKIVRLTSKGAFGPDVVVEDQEAFATSFSTLHDQANNKVRYEIRFNRDEFEAVRDSGFAVPGSYGYAGPILPDGQTFSLPDNRNGATGHGAIELKAAWKILTDADDPNRYYNQEVVVHDEGGDPECKVERMGLIGLHIMRKTYHAPQWTFATFEHVDNVPPAGSFGDGRRYTLFSDACAVNEPTDCWAIQPPVNDMTHTCCANLQFNTGLLPPTPNHTTRLVPIGPTDLNERYRQVLADAGSVFQHYQLVNSQYTLGGRDPANPERVREYFCNPKGIWAIPAAFDDCFTVVPDNLRNTSMETYMASYGATTTQVPSDSCLNCHAAGGIDMSYIWLDAKTLPVSIQE